MNDALLDKVRDRINATVWRMTAAPDALAPDQGFAAIMDLVETALVLARREAWAEPVEGAGCPDASEAARRRYPLPTRTRQVLREEPDPIDPARTYRATNEIRPSASLVHLFHGIVQPSEAWPAPTLGRAALWSSMMREPYRTEEVPGDESNPWGA